MVTFRIITEEMVLAHNLQLDCEFNFGDKELLLMDEMDKIGLT